MRISVGRPRVTRVEVLAAALVVSILFGEGLARWLGLASPPGGDRIRWWTQFIRPSDAPLLVWELVPGAAVEGREAHGSVLYRVNSMGLRGRAIDPRKGSGVFRVLALGDSFTFGLEGSEEDSLPSQLERLANARSSVRIEVLNGGTPGYNTRQELAWLLQRGLTLEPDLVILGVAVGDVDPIMLQQWPAQVPQELWPNPEAARRPRSNGPASSAGGLDDWLKQRSALYELATSRWDALLVRSGLREPGGLGVLGDYQSREWLWLRGAVQEMQVALRRRGVGFAIWIYPSPEELSRERWPVLGSLFQRWSDESGVPIVDLWPVFRQRHWRPLFRVFGHLTGEGNEIAAETVLGFLVTKGLLP